MGSNLCCLRISSNARKTDDIDKRPFGIFNSCVEELTFWRLIMNRLPVEDIISFEGTKRFSDIKK